MRYLLIILIWFTILFSILGCRTKKKVTERENVKIETAKTETISEKVETTTKIDCTLTKKNETILIDKNETIELKQADPDKVITIENEKGDKLVIKGADARIIKNDSQVLKTDESVLNRIQDTSTDVLTDKTITDNAKTTKNKRTSDSFVKTIPTSLIIIVVIVVLFIIYRKFSI